MINKLVATTLFGLEDVLARELEELGAENVRKYRRAVRFEGSNALIYKLNLSLRTALRILKQIRSFKVKDYDTLYNEIYRIEWQDLFSYKNTFLINSVVNSQYFKHSHFVAQKAKDAVVDKFRHAKGIRPSVSTKDADVVINIHISDQYTDVSLDSSGDPLFKRGYREYHSEAPLNEVLAAGMILMTGWKGDKDFVDPMCGSGTLPIEAAMIARDIPPGIFRKGFAFRNWLDFDEDLFNRIAETTLKGKVFNHKIIGADISAEAVSMASKNAGNAMLEDVIEFKRSDFKDLLPDSDSGLIIVNPPYDERIKSENVVNLYQSIGNHLKRNFPGYQAWILSGNTEGVKHIGLKPFLKMDLINGGIDCKYLAYDLFKGKRKEFLYS